uniref:Uncharacterized protein n=1 Tax=Panagrellus redivivus TaxID=6233 RepID=A0A7E4ZZK4_PANRE
MAGEGDSSVQPTTWKHYPPTINGAKSEPVNSQETPLIDEPEVPKTSDDKQRDYGIETSEPPISIGIGTEKLTKPVNTLPPKTGYEEPTAPQSNPNIVPSGYSAPGTDSTTGNNNYSPSAPQPPPPSSSGYRNDGVVPSSSGTSSIGISSGRYDGPVGPSSSQIEVSPGTAENEGYGDDTVPEDPYETKSVGIPPAPGKGRQGVAPAPYDARPEPQAPPFAPSFSQSPAPVDEFYKSPPGVQPELFPENKPIAPQEQYVPAGPAPPSNVGDFFAEEEHPAQPQPQRPQVIRPTLSRLPDSDADLAPEFSGPRPCCPCCHESRPDFPPRGPILGGDGGGCGGGGGGVAPSGGGCGGGCGGTVLCGAPPIVGTPPQCCPTAPLPCCPRLPTCCLPQLPCCPKIEIPCCPPIQVCCQPLNFGGCGGGCRSKAVVRVRTKRLGCLPCIGRKKRDAFTDAEEPHIRQKRLNCIPCLARQKRQAQNNCQKCNPLMQHVVSRVKRSFSCSACATHKERVKRQAAISDYYRGNIAGANRNCQVCNTLPLPHSMKKRSISPAQNDFLARVKRGDDTGYDPLFKCDAGCCDFTKCIRSKPLRETFKVPEDSDFVDKHGDYDLPDLKSEEDDDDASFRHKSKARN